MSAFRLDILQRTLLTAAIIFSLVLLWSLTHRYKGLAGDAELYAFQALARTNPALADDLYLQNVSQDKFTIFSPFYAWCIGLVGLPAAAQALLFLSKLGLLIAAWSLGRRLSNDANAVFSVALLIITLGSYGAHGVFHYLEDYLTARSLAEALVVMSIAFYFQGRRVLGLLIAIGALFVHPLMALPGLLVLLCLSTSPRIAIVGAVAGILTTLGISLTGKWAPSNGGLFAIMDADWINVISERSQFLFLQFWSTNDWKIAARPFITLTLSVLVSDNQRVRKLCMAVMLVGASGLAVALVSSLFGPVAILLQGQAWRWVWVASFVGVLLLAPTAIRAWNDDAYGPLSAVLLIAGWTVTSMDGALCTALALLLWLLRDRVMPRIAHNMRWIAVVAGTVIFVWAIASSWTTLNTPSRDETAPAFWPMMIMRNLMGLGAVPTIIIGSFAYGIRTSKTIGVATACWCAILIAAACSFPEILRNILRVNTPSHSDEFTEWRRVIPAHSNVFVVPSPTSAGFAWFTLERPSYLSLNQSSGVVFSRETSLEVRRRAEVVLPLWNRSWQIRLHKHSSYNGSSSGGDNRPLTRAALMTVCRDPKLTFVVAKENVGFDPVQHTQNGLWKNWNLYDCQHVKSEMASPHE